MKTLNLKSFAVTFLMICSLLTTSSNSYSQQSTNVPTATSKLNPDGTFDITVNGQVYTYKPVDGNNALPGAPNPTGVMVVMGVAVVVVAGFVIYSVYKMAQRIPSPSTNSPNDEVSISSPNKRAAFLNINTEGTNTARFSYAMESSTNMIHWYPETFVNGRITNSILSLSTFDAKGVLVKSQTIPLLLVGGDSVYVSNDTNGISISTEPMKVFRLRSLSQ